MVENDKASRSELHDYSQRVNEYSAYCVAKHESSVSDPFDAQTKEVGASIDSATHGFSEFQ
jgi:hypothetical protein